jgi:hypothetical protein
MMLIDLLPYRPVSVFVAVDIANPDTNKSTNASVVPKKCLLLFLTITDIDIALHP